MLVIKRLKDTGRVQQRVQRQYSQPE